LFDTIDAIKILICEGRNINLQVCGNGSHDIVEQISKMAKKYHWLIYNGVVCGDNKYDILANSHIFVLPTYYSIEGMPVSLLEAASMKNLIVATDQGAISDFLIEGETGFFCKAKNPEDLACVLRYILDHKYDMTEILNNAIELICNNYDEKKFENNIFKFLA
jgi:glycosyltransferase involved in cell wall biosynthesis